MFLYLNTAVPTCGLEALLSSDTHSPSMFLLEFVFIRHLAAHGCEWMLPSAAALQ